MLNKESPFKKEQASDSPGFLLFQVVNLWQAALQKIFQKCGITQTQYAILASLKYFAERGESSTQSHLVEHSHIEKMTLSKAVRSLEEQQLVTRERSAEDGRLIFVKLSDRGESLILEAIQLVEDEDERFFGSLSSMQRDEFREIALTLIQGNVRGLI